jgi:hypothetical protein
VILLTLFLLLFFVSNHILYALPLLFYFPFFYFSISEISNFENLKKGIGVKGNGILPFKVKGVTFY